MSEERIIRNMRHMAWERAKGELKSVLHTFWDDDPKYEDINKEILDFIARVEGEGLHE